jgi:ceramide glucosyltransferase
MIEAVTVACLALAALGCVYTLAAVLLVRRFFTIKPAQFSNPMPGVTIIKPLRGAEPQLFENLASFCAQDYAGPVQLLFGVADASDPAVSVVERLMREQSSVAVRLVITAEASGGNPKIANLLGLEGHIAHEMIVLSDSDIAVSPDYLTRTIATLCQSNVGLVTWLYRGAPRGGIFARLASMAIDYHFLPSVVVGMTLHLANPCFGSTIALRRETLVAIGGFAAFRDQLADDHAIGEAVRAKGLRVAVPPAVVVHTCSEESASALWQHELRWNTTIRSIDPLGYAGAVITHPLVFALLAALLAGFNPATVTILLGVLACRLVLALQVDHTLAMSPTRWWLIPARDVWSFVIYVASFFTGTVTWRGHRYRVSRDGMLEPTRKPTS